MKKRIFIMIIALLFATGCTCEYNLKIDGDTYKEQIKLVSTNQEEASLFNKDWEIPANKEQSNIGEDPSTTDLNINNIYKYNLLNNTLTFNYDFSQNKYQSSLAVAKCYNNLTVTNYENSIIISTPSKAICFDNYPSLDNVIVNITVDKKVISNNADSISGNVYTWKLNKNNASNKSINLVLNNSDAKPSSGSSNNDNNPNQKQKKDYTMYIFCGILLIVLLVGYLIFNKIKNKEDAMDD